MPVSCTLLVLLCKTNVSFNQTTGFCMVYMSVGLIFTMTSEARFSCDRSLTFNNFFSASSAGCYLRAGQMMRVRPVHVVGTVIIHVNQLVGQHRPHLLLRHCKVGADDDLVVSEVISTQRVVRCQT